MSLQDRDTTPLSGFTVNVPEWFQDQGFQEWLNNPDNPVFTWHKKGTAVSEWSDVVVCVDPSLNGEGSESDMPEAIWDQIVDLCKAHYTPGGGSHIHVRLTNLDLQEHE
jgi:hypothetical protein